MPAHTEIDEIFHLKLGWWTDRAVISQKVQITDDSYTIRGSLRYMACGHGTCQSPQNETFEFVSRPTPAEAKAPTEEPGQDAVATSKRATDKSQLSESVDIYSPVNTVSAAKDNSETDSSHSLWYVFLGGLLGGFVALLTPCGNHTWWQRPSLRYHQHSAVTPQWCKGWATLMSKFECHLMCQMLHSFAALFHRQQKQSQ